VRVGGEHDPLGEPPLVVGLLLGPLAGHDQDYPERRPGQVPCVALDRGEGAQRVPISDYHDLPGLFVGRAPRPAGHLQDIVNDLLRYRVGSERADGAQGAQKGDPVSCGSFACGLAHSSLALTPIIPIFTSTPLV
jgi:hypothetical protein